MSEQRKSGGDAAAVEAPPAPARGESRLGPRMRGLYSACRQVFGIPDYERYLAHAAERHPGVPVLTLGEFSAREIERKYGKGGMRCC